MKKIQKKLQLLELNKYDSIIPCGIKNKGVTSLKKLGVSNFNNIEKIIADNFLDIFH